MNTLLVLPTLCASAAVWVALSAARGPSLGPRLHRLTGPAPDPGVPPGAVGARHDTPRNDPGVLAVSVLAALAPVVLVGGVVGLLAGPVVGGAVWRTLRAREPTAARRHREQVSGALPHVVDLLAVALASGASPGAALATVAAAVGPPVARELRAVEHGLALGRDPVRVWKEAAAVPGLEALGHAMVRAVDTGASVADALHRLAEDLHAAERLTAETRARSVGVRVAAPLGLCLLPAFVLVGVVPLVAGTVAALLGT